MGLSVFCTAFGPRRHCRSLSQFTAKLQSFSARQTDMFQTSFPQDRRTCTANMRFALFRKISVISVIKPRGQGRKPGGAQGPGPPKAAGTEKVDLLGFCVGGSCWKTHTTVIRFTDDDTFDNGLSMELITL